LGEPVPISQHQLSLYHPPGHVLATPGNPFGKDIANAGLFRALARFGGYSALHVLHQSGASVEQLSLEFYPPGGPQGQLSTGSLWNTALAARSGLLLRGQPYLSELAWLRRSAGPDAAYSLAGLIHTIAPPAIREQMAAAALAPVQSWDALICTSPAVQAAMEQLFEQQAAHFHERLGASRAPRPQLPLIPLAVEVEAIAAQAADGGARQALRQRLAIPDHELLVLWVGRLSYFEKAFPQVMLQAVQQAAQRCGQRLHFALVGWFPNGETDLRLYQQAAEQLAPDVNVLVLDGNDSQLLAQSWAAADVFLSLVDNIQETFGLAPVEAMAAGLPVVVSDWDGYRYTVRDGVDGLLIPTLGSPGGAPGELLAQLHTLGLEAYQIYVGAVAQHTAVHLGRATDALVQLVRSPEQRAAMGAAGQRRARQMFSWPVVVGQYNALFAELAERRARALRDGEVGGGARIQPNRGDPFADFRGFASAVLDPDRRLRLAAGRRPADLEHLLAVQLNRLYPGLRGSLAEATALLEQLQVAGGAGATPAQLLASAAPARRPYLETTLVWLAKLGLVDWLP
jgi:D-inositol-3-phosphate glycosyltransferase